MHLLVIGAQRCECRVSTWGSRPCLETGFLGKRRGERGVLPIGNHPAHDVAAEDVNPDIDRVEGRPALGHPETGDVDTTRSGWARGHQLGLGLARMTALIARLSHWLIRGQDLVHRALDAQVLAFIEFSVATSLGR